MRACFLRVLFFFSSSPSLSFQVWLFAEYLPFKRPDETPALWRKVNLLRPQVRLFSRPPYREHVGGRNIYAASLVEPQRTGGCSVRVAVDQRPRCFGWRRLFSAGIPQLVVPVFWSPVFEASFPIDRTWCGCGRVSGCQWLLWRRLLAGVESRQSHVGRTK